TVRLEHERRAVTRPEPAATDGKPVLSVRNLGKIYGGGGGWFGGKSFALKAVDDVSLDLYPGENLGIVGESGSGKTTLGRRSLRPVEPPPGPTAYHLPDGPVREVTALPKQELRSYHRDVRLVCQDPFASLNPRVTVKDVIGDPLVVSGLARRAELERRVG